MRIPRHLAMIMDGNGRWAEQRSLPRIAGHRQGVATVQSIVKECRALGVGFLTLYAFSSENWGRPSEEVQALMELLGQFLESEVGNMLAQDIRLNVIGEIDRLPDGVRNILQSVTARTADRNGMILTLALSYGSRDELVRAARALARRAAAGEIASDAVDEQTLEAALDTADLPDPDLLIRTSGEMRISNFLLWQLAYSELYFTPVFWPDFDVGQLHRAFEEFGQRQRRFGLTPAQLGDSGFDAKEDSD